MESSRSARENRRYILAFILLAGPFYANDLANLYITDWQWWLLVDYTGVKLFPLLVAAWMIGAGHMRASEFGLRAQPVGSFTATFLIVGLIGTLLDQNGYRLVSGLPQYPALGGMPAITSPTWNWIDLTFGLLMVGVCEELVFRGFMHTFLGRFTQSPLAIVVISSIAFGLIHWSLGLHGVVVTSAIGAVFMGAYLKTRSLPAIMAAHVAVNFIDFAGVVPKTWLQLPPVF